MDKDNVIIIPVHNELDLLVRCVDSIILKTKNPKIIIINDGSDEQTTKWIKLKTRENLFKSIHNPVAVGYSSACNMGIDLAMKVYNFSIICLLNSDTEVITPHWFDKVKYAMLHGDNVGCAGVLSNNATHHSLPGLNGKIYEPLAHENINNYIRRISENRVVYCNFINGFCYFIRKELIHICGTFDSKEFPHYGSEDDYSLRAVSQGFKNIIVDNVFIYHHECKSYTNKRRLDILQKSVPALKKRWGAEYIGICWQEACNALSYLKVKERYPL